MLKKGAASFVTSGVVALARMTQHCKLNKIHYFLGSARAFLCICTALYRCNATYIPPTHSSTTSL